LNELFVILRGFSRSFLAFFITSSLRFLFGRLLLDVSGFGRQAERSPRDVSLSPLVEPLLDANPVPASIDSLFSSVLIQPDWLAAGRALSLLNQPRAQTVHVEDVATCELLALSNIAQTDAALQLVICIRLDVLQSPQLDDELPPLIQRDDALA
jgi:hypothetical protein